MREMCSYQQAMDAPSAMGGHTLLGATLLNTYCVPCSPFGTGKYGGAIKVSDLILEGWRTAMAKAKMQPRE